MTSLAQQLNKLRAPQTSILVDRKKRPSILFDEKVAATKDRETIYDIGYSGLQQLIALNQSFTQFETTLFDKNALDLQRAVENIQVNKQLNEVIKKFLAHLSPYFLLDPAHKCLEWLIRRFNINDYNKDEFMFLILPYHETRVFIKCVQTMNLNGATDKWNWLREIQVPGVPLSKRALLNRVASDNYLFSFVCESVGYAAEQLDTRAHTLQVYYAFYGTTLIGALELATVSEAHVTNIYKAIRKGLKSNSVDFCAASMMILGQLVSKTKLSTSFLESIMRRVSSIQHPSLQSDTIILLVLIYKSQSEMLPELPSSCLKNLIESKWIPSVLARTYSEGIDIMPFYLSLLTACLRNVQLKGDGWKQSKKFVDSLFQECFFKGPQAERVIRCVLNGYIIRENTENSVITIESENEDDDGMLSNDSQDTNTWYTNLLKSLERQYSNIFDQIVKEILVSQNSSISESKKKSLKTVLGFLFTIVCTDDNVNIFEKLYHHSAQHRIEAVKYLVKNLEKMCFSDDSKDLLKDSIAERISDDSPIVVHEALKFSTQNLIKIVGRQQLEMKLVAALEQTLANPSIWDGAGLSALKHLTSAHICNESNATIIFISVLPFLLQDTGLGFTFIKIILNSSLSRHVEFIRICKEEIGSNECEEDAIDSTLAVFESKRGFPNPTDILKYINSIDEKDLTVSKAFYSMLVLGYSVRQNCTPEVSLQILEVITKFSTELKTGVVPDNSKWMTNAAMGIYPINLNVACIKNIIDCTNFVELNLNELNFTHTTTTLYSLHKIFECLITGLASKRAKHGKFALYAEGFNYLFETLFSRLEDKIELFTNYCIIDVTQKAVPASVHNAITLEQNLQVFTIKYFKTILEQSQDRANTQLSLKAMIRILACLHSTIAEVREATFSLLSELVRLQPNVNSLLIQALLERQEEILMDENQLPLILYTVFRKSSKEMKALNETLISFIINENNDSLLVALLLQSLQHVNPPTTLEKISKAALNNLNNASTELSATNTKMIVLDPFKSMIIENILNRLTPQTIGTVKKSEDVWHMLLKSFENHNIFLKPSTKTKSVTTVILEIIDADLFSELTAEHQTQLIKAAVTSATFSEDVDVAIGTTKFFKKIQINAKFGVDLLNDMVKVQIADKLEGMDVDSPMTGSGKANSRRRRNSGLISSDFSNLSPEVLKTKQWKRGITWLERLQNKQKMSNSHVLVSPLFAILQKCLDFEDQSGVEYGKQLVLSCILNCCQTLGKLNRELLPENVFKVESVVKCIRGTQNPQTHHYAMQLLAYIAKFIPEQVLHNMMDIFTFVGSSVVRHDDAYSFQIINNIIGSIIPSLIKMHENKSQEERNALVVPVLKVFSDIILDVPEHRRLPLYVKLLETLNVDGYLWMFLAALFESYIMNSKSTGSGADKEVGLPRRFEIALTLTKQFSCETIIKTSTKLFQFLQKLPMCKPTNVAEKLPSEVAALFNVNTYTNQQFRHFKYTFLHFVNTLTSSTEFMNKIAALTEEETKQMKPHYQKAIITILMYIPDVSKATETSEQSHLHYWKVMLHNCYEILDNVISLLSPNMLLVVVNGLLSHKLPGVRRKVIELLINKLQMDSFFSESDEDNLIGLLDPLRDIIESILDEEKLIQTASPVENTAIQQISLIAVKLLSKHLAEKYSIKFKGILDILVQVIRKSDDVSRLVLGSVVLCLAEICSNLRADSIAVLSRFMPMLNKILQKQLENQISTNDNVLFSIITATQKIIETLVLFLSPYLVDLVVLLSQIWEKVRENTVHDSKHAALISRFNNIWEKLATMLSLRVLIPTVERSYVKLVDDENYKGIGPVMRLLTQAFKHLPSSEISNFNGEITSLLLKVLQFRAQHSTVEITTINSLEDDIIQSCTALTLKLSEGNFRPLYCKIYDWALRNNEDEQDQAITFFRLSSEIAKSLKSLFTLFAGDFVQDAADWLNKLNISSEMNEGKQIEDLTRPAMLIESIIETLYQTFLYGSTGFVNHSRFDVLLQPLVDQIENEIVIKSSSIPALLSKCLAQLGLATNDDTLWKQLNYQILMKTRNNSSEIRIFALQACVELAQKFGEDYMPLLPETIPFLAELLEDETPEVEKQCQRSVQELEKVVGEPLQKYF